MSLSIRRKSGNRQAGVWDGWQLGGQAGKVPLVRG